jgi:NhaA family Na+:H+ antiporter
MVLAALALVGANSPLAPSYFGLFHADVLGLSVLHWINDALMALFFLRVGLEIKRELLVGELSTGPQRVLPGIAALGGMVAPALIYAALNAATTETLRGWAIPTATDIAFSLGVLALLGPRVPVSLKIFLTALAILDDLGAVAVIAVFYTAGLSPLWLGVSVALLAVLAALNRLGVERLTVYLACGVLLWFALFKSGVHATLAGVAVAMFVPLRDEQSPLHKLEHALHPWGTFLIVPVFGFANAGVALSGLTLARLAEPVTLGIAAGLFVGKQLGVFASIFAAVKLGAADRPLGASWPQLYGISLLCGIGFTMSLFVGLLAFPDSPALQDALKVGVLAGSALSALAGALVLLLSRRRLTPKPKSHSPTR